jgi:hypothetical protein
MQPEEISRLPFDLAQLQAPTPEQHTKLTWKTRSGKVESKPIAVCDISVDLEGSGGRLQALNGTCAIGMAAYARTGRQQLFAHEWAVEALAGRDDPSQIEWWQSSDANKAAWARILWARRPRREVAAELRALVERLKALGWTVHLLMRPAAYDFRELTAFFQTLGVQVLADRLATRRAFQDGRLAPNEILDQACCAYDLEAAAPPHYDARNNMESPFGFGGASQVTDIGQQIAAFHKALGPPSELEFDFGVVLGNVVGRQLIHSGKQDAIDQASVWYAVVDAVEALVAAQRALFSALETLGLGDASNCWDKLQQVQAARDRLHKLLA